jgi:hypothetical protein
MWCPRVNHKEVNVPLWHIEWLPGVYHELVNSRFEPRHGEDRFTLTWLTTRFGTQVDEN